MSAKSAFDDKYKTYAYEMVKQHIQSLMFPKDPAFSAIALVSLQCSRNEVAKDIIIRLAKDYEITPEELEASYAKDGKTRNHVGEKGQRNEGSCEESGTRP